MCCSWDHQMYPSSQALLQRVRDPALEAINAFSTQVHFIKNGCSTGNVRGSHLKFLLITMYVYTCQAIMYLWCQMSTHHDSWTNGSQVCHHDWRANPAHDFFFFCTLISFVICLEQLLLLSTFDIHLVCNFLSSVTYGNPSSQCLSFYDIVCNTARMPFSPHCCPHMPHGSSHKLYSI